MAKTYKDKLKRIQKNYWKCYPDYVKLKPKDKIKVDNWFKQTPGWWHLMQHQQPFRRKVREMIKSISKEDSERLWPSHKKPHTYYW